MDSRQALLERMALCHPGDTVAGVFLHYALVYVQAHGSSEDVAEARVAVGRPAPVEATGSLPAVRLLHLLDVAGRVATAGQRPFAQGLQEVGEATGTALFRPPPRGGTARPGPLAALEQLPALTRATCSFGLLTLTRPGPSTACLQVRGDLLGPAWTVGLVRGALRAAGLEEVEVSTQVHRPPGCDVDVWLRWEAGSAQAGH